MPNFTKIHLEFWSLKRPCPWLILMALILVSSPACSKNTATPGIITSGNASPAGYSIAIKVESKIVDYLTLDQLKKLEKVAVRAADRDNNGPTLASVLNLAGIKDYKTVKVVGMDRGRMATAELTLTSQQVTDKTILDITNRGTCKFVSPDVVFENWIYDITTLEIGE
jgi:hypothetical protein